MDLNAQQSDSSANLVEDPLFTYDFTSTPDITDSDITQFLQDYHTENFLLNKSRQYDFGTRALADLDTPNIFDMTIRDDRGIISRIGGYSENTVHFAGGVLKGAGTPIAESISSGLNDPIGVLHKLNSFLRVIADTAYAGTIDVFARGFGLGNGAWERTGARIDSFARGANASINAFESNVIYNYQTNDFMGLGENLSGGVIGAIGAVTPRRLFTAGGQDFVPNKTNDFVTFYHGTSSEAAASIRSAGIDLSKSRTGTDFGQGFYTTTDEAQALRWVQERHPGGEVLEFSVPRSSFEKFDNLDTSNITDSSLSRFFMHNRLKGRLHSHDTVSGPLLANPNKFLDGAEARTFGQQTSFHSSELLELLYLGLKKQ